MYVVCRLHAFWARERRTPYEQRALARLAVCRIYNNNNDDV